jgi:putative transposase
MKLTAKVKLQPTPDQRQFLLATLETTNAACNEISEVAWQHRTFNQFGLQKLVYTSIRESTGLTAQVVIRAISKVADAYKLDKQSTPKGPPTFKLQGGIAYDARILRWFLAKQEVSIWSVARHGTRLRIPFVCGQRQLELLQRQRGESDLCLVDGEFYLFATCEIETPEPSEVDGFLGIDLGVTNIAVDSTGEVHQGKTIRAIRYRRRELRLKLQAKGTKSTRRRLKKLSGKEQRFATDTNHVISKHIVEKAKCTGQGIAVEALTGIRGRVKATKPQRATLHSWSFAQLRAFIEYKAALMGVPVVAVDPRNTSRTYPCCGHVDKANRRTQAKFLCMDCGYSDLADHIAAWNISRRAVVNPPHFSTTDIDFRP